MINVSDQHAPRSLIVTLYGAYGRFAPGPVPVAELIRLLAAVGVDAPSVRSSVSRLKRRGLLLPARTAAGRGRVRNCRRTPASCWTTATGASTPRRRPEDEGWVLAVFSVPESERQKRHVLRSRLAGLGFGTAAPGVWIAPAGLYEETRHTLQRLRLDPYVDLFRGEHLGFAATAEAVARWWDLARDRQASTRRSSTGTSRCCASLGAADGRGSRRAEEAYRDYLLRPGLLAPELPYADPGLPGRDARCPRGLAAASARPAGVPGVCTTRLQGRGGRRSSRGRLGTPCRPTTRVACRRATRDRVRLSRSVSRGLGASGAAGRSAGGGCPRGTGAGQGAPGPVVALLGRRVQGPVRVVQVRAGQRAQVGAPGQEQGVDVVPGGDGADRDDRDAERCCGSGRRTASGTSGRTRGARRRRPARWTRRSRRRRARRRRGRSRRRPRRVVPPSAQSVAEMRTVMGRSAGHTSRTASKTSSGKRSRSVERAAVGVGAAVGERGEEAGEQIAVGAVQFEEVEAGAGGAPGGRGELLADRRRVRPGSARAGSG